MALDTTKYVPLEDSALLEEMIKAIVSQPDKVKIVSVNSQPTQDSRTTVLAIHTADNDRGFIIGRGGVMIRNLQMFFNAIGAQTDRRILLEVVESTTRPPRAKKSESFVPKINKPFTSSSSKGSV